MILIKIRLVKFTFLNLSTVLYEKLIESWRLKPNENSEEFPWKLSNSLIEQNQEKINQYLRLREILLEYSKSSLLIIMYEYLYSIIFIQILF